MDELNENLSKDANAAKEDAKAQINQQTKALKSVEEKWKTESKQNVSLKAWVTRLEKDISAAQAKQDALDRTAQKAKEEGKDQRPANENNATKAQISQPRKDITAAKAEQQALDAANSQATDEAHRARAVEKH